MKKKDSYFDNKIIEHIFFKKMLELNIDLLKKHEKEVSDGFLRSLRDFAYRHEIELDTRDLWVLNATKALFRLNTAVESLRFSASRITQLKIYAKTSVVEIKFHIENYLIRLTTVRDIFLQFLNEFFSIGVPARHVSDKIILKNSNITSEATKNQISKVLQYIKTRAYLRNQIIHHADFVNDSYRVLSIMENSAVFPPVKLKDFKHLFRDEESEKIQEELNTIGDLITAVFDTLVIPNQK